jgi:hypothetical protein
MTHLKLNSKEILIYITEHLTKLIDDIATGKLTTGADIIGSKYTNIGGATAPGATIPAPTNTPKISSGEAGIALYNSLPPGSMYIDPNGNLKQKK